MEAVELRLVASVVIPLGNSEPFVERLARLLEARTLRIRIAQQAKV